jgi:3,4-dihydroxy 2-butanone 4-phosphate synthase / GTP cyclohydrolase II
MAVYMVGQEPQEHLALVIGSIQDTDDVLVRVHSECLTGDLFGAENCDCGEQLERSLQLISAAGCGMLIYLRQEGRGIGLVNKLRAINLMNQGYDTVDASIQLGLPVDSRDYTIAAKILHSWNVRSIQLITNNPEKMQQLASCGIKINQRIELTPLPTIHNQAYLATKQHRMGHLYILESL